VIFILKNNDETAGIWVLKFEEKVVLYLAILGGHLKVFPGVWCLNNL
jgi:hypothetical protein